MGVDRRAFTPTEPDERDAHLIGELCSEARRRRNGCHYGDPGQVTLLDELKRGAARHLHDRLGGRQPIVAQRGADHLIDGVMPTDILAHVERGAIETEQTGGMQPAGAVKKALLGAQ